MMRIQIPGTHLHRIAAAALVFALAACAPHTLQIFIDPATTPTATAEIPQLTSEPEEPTITATPAETTPTSTPAEPTPTATIARPPAGNEWLLVETEQGLWMSRPDGSQAGIRIPARVIIPGALSNAISPAGGLFAYISTSADPSLPYGPYDPSRLFGPYPDLTLNIMSLSGAAPTVAIPLIPPAAEPGPSDTSQIQIAITTESSIAWSPDGSRLAFIGAQEGSSADLYGYYRVNGQVVRLTDGPNQAYRPQWSPDGAWIVHGAAGGFGTGAGYGVTGFYAARADGGEILSLYPISERSGDEVVAGWLDGHTLVASTWMQPCGLKILRLVDLSASTVNFVFEGCMSDVAVGKNAVLFAQSELPDSSDAELPPGSVYLLTASDRTPRLIGTQKIRWIKWTEEIGAFLAVTRDFGVLEISPAGDIRELPAMAPRMPAVSPDGRWWAISHSADHMFSNSDGIFIGEYGTELRQIFEGTIAYDHGVLFSPAGNSLYFVTAGGELYRALAPDWSPALLATGLTPAHGYTDLAWWEGE
jgi:hypothetical protein